jgi:hypothetical protein
MILVTNEMISPYRNCSPCLDCVGSEVEYRFSTFNRRSSPQSSPANLGRESGAFMPMFVATTLFIIAMLGLALETANLTMSSLRIYNAVDASIQTAPLLFVGHSYSQSEISDRLDALTKANFESDGLPQSRLVNFGVTFGTDAGGAINRATIDATVRAPYWFLPAALDVGNFADLNARTSVTVPRVNMAVIIDLSKSMTDEDDPTSPSGTQRKAETAAGGLYFIGEWLRDTFDRIALISFSDASTRIADFQSGGGYNRAEIQSRLFAMQDYPSGWTNMSSGFYDARTNFASISPGPDDLNAVVVMSDGHLTHGKANFVNTTGLPSGVYHFQAETFDSLADGCGASGTDHVSVPITYTLRKDPNNAPPWLSEVAPYEPQETKQITRTWERYCHRTSTTTDPNTGITSPVCVEYRWRRVYQTVGKEYSGREPANHTEPDAPPGECNNFSRFKGVMVPDCQDMTNLKTALFDDWCILSSADILSTTWTSSQQNCMNTLAIDGAGYTVDLGALDHQKDGSDANKWRELAYYATIVQADKIRREKDVTVLTLGIGGPRGAPKRAPDPWPGGTPNNSYCGTYGDAVFNSNLSPSAQSLPQGDFTRHFFKRLAMSPKAKDDTTEPTFQKVPKIKDMLADPNLTDLAGDYFEANGRVSADEILRLIFGKMKFKKTE